MCKRLDLKFYKSSTNPILSSYNSGNYAINVTKNEGTWDLTNYVFVLSFIFEIQITFTVIDTDLSSYGRILGPL